MTRAAWMRSRAALQELRELRAREDRLGLAERLDLLVARLLPDIEVLHREVARLVQVRVLILELLLLVLRSLEALLRRGLVRLSSGLLRRLVRDVTGLLLDRRVRVLHVRLVGLLRIGLRLDGVGLELLGLGDDLVQHAEHATGT